jgi:hypothetical protein
MQLYYHPLWEREAAGSILPPDKRNQLIVRLMLKQRFTFTFYFQTAQEIYYVGTYFYDIREERQVVI